jgi:uncharacterized protein (DUF305 family)
MKSTSTISVVFIALVAISSCGEKTSSAAAINRNDSVQKQQLSDSVLMANQSRTLDPHSEDMLRIVEKINTSIDQHQRTNNFDMEFAKLMSIQHQAAIELTGLELRVGTNDDLRELAQTMSEYQEKQIGELMQIVRDTRLKMSEGKQDTSAANINFIDSVLNKSRLTYQLMSDAEPTGNIDLDFAKLMLSQHKQTSDISEIAAKNTKNPKLKKLAQQMISTHEDGLKELQKWLKKYESKGGEGGEKKA